MNAEMQIEVLSIFYQKMKNENSIAGENSLAVCGLNNIEAAFLAQVRQRGCTMRVGAFIWRQSSLRQGAPELVLARIHSNRRTVNLVLPSEYVERAADGVISPEVADAIEDCIATLVR